jgi:membrane fusion protein (multidrug efflux system)
MNDKEHDSEPPEPKGKVRLGLILFILLVLIGVGLVAGFLPRMHQKEETKKDSEQLSETSVALVSPEPGKKEDGLVLPAEVQPMQQASIYARVDGYLKKWQADIGAKVKAGDVLAEIETPEADRALDQALAQVGVADVSLKLAQATEVRSQGLLKVSAVSKQDADEKTAAVGVAQATLESQRANANRLEQLQSFQKVVAPFDGIITVRNVDMGDLISAGGTKELFHLAQTDMLRVYVRVPQTQAAGIVVGQTAELLIPEMPDQKFEAKVATTSEAISANSRTLLTELHVKNPTGLIRVGSYAQVRFSNVAKSAVLTVPASAVIFRSEGTQVAVVKPNGDDHGVVELRKVELGRDYGQRVEVTNGLSADDKIIAAPFDSLVNGMTVRIASGTPDKKG